MTVLMIAPTRSDLPNVAIEAAAVVNALGGKLVQGPVSERDVRDEASAGGFDGIWFATHADGSRVLLSGEEYLSEAALVAYVAASGAAWCFINTCQSISLGQRIVNETKADVICTIAANPDAEAMRTGVLFSRQLRLLLNTRDAYERSKPGDNRIYVYLGNYRQRVEMSPTSLLPLTPAGTDRLQITMDDMRRDMSKMSTDVEVLKERTATIDERLKKIEQIVRPPANLPTWAMLLIGLLAAIVVVFAMLQAGI